MTILRGRYKSLWSLSLVCLLSLLLAACASSDTKQKKDEEGLLLAVERFMVSMRWDDYKAASLWVAPEAQESFWKRADRFQDHLHIMDFEVRNASLGPDGGSAKVLISVRFYHTTDPELRTARLKQGWIFSESEKRWLLTVPGLRALDEKTETSSSTSEDTWESVQ